MEDWKKRLIVEQKELKEKFIKLIEFINSDEFYELSINNKQLLKNQKIAMELYLSVLNMRVYEDVDKITVPDLGIMCMMSNVFGGNGLFKTSDSNISYLENKLKEDTKD